MLKQMVEGSGGGAAYEMRFFSRLIGDKTPREAFPRCARWLDEAAGGVVGALGELGVGLPSGQRERVAVACGVGVLGLMQHKVAVGPLSVPETLVSTWRHDVDVETLVSTWRRRRLWGIVEVGMMQTRGKGRCRGEEEEGEEEAALEERGQQSTSSSFHHLTRSAASRHTRLLPSLLQVLDVDAVVWLQNQLQALSLVAAILLSAKHFLDHKGCSPTLELMQSLMGRFLALLSAPTTLDLLATELS